MNNEILNLINRWDKKTNKAMMLKDISLSKTQELLKETYRVLTVYHKEECVPKQIVQLFLAMEDFLYFSSLMEEKEKEINFYHWQEIFCIIKTFEKDFLNGNFQYEYPLFLISDVLDKSILINFNEDIFAKLLEETKK